MNRWGKIMLSIAVMLGVAALVFLIVIRIGRGPYRQVFALGCWPRRLG